MKRMMVASGTVLALVAGAVYALEVANVDQKGLSFSASALTVNKGTAVTFHNSDETAHNILIRGSGVVFNSGLQKPGVTFTAPFRKIGKYDVNCGIHPNMHMTVIVK